MFGRAFWTVAALLCATAATLWWWGQSDSHGNSPDELFAAAMEAIDRNDLAAGRELLDSLLNSHPDHTEALLYRGQLLMEEGLLAAALRDWRSVPDVPERFGGTARYLEGAWLLREGRAREAEALLLRAVALHPSYLQPREMLLELYANQLRKEQVREVLKAIGTLRPWRLEDCALQLIAGKPVVNVEASTRRLKSYIAADAEDRASRIGLCRLWLQSGQPDPAIKELKSLLESDPSDRESSTLLATALFDQGDVAAAGQLIQSESLDENASFDLWHLAGRLAARRADWSGASECLRNAIRLDPFNAAATHALGTALARQSNPEADQYLRSATQLDLIERNAFLVLRGLDRNPAQLAAKVVDIAEQLQELKFQKQAVEWFAQAVALDPTNNRALAGWQQGRQMQRWQSDHATSERAAIEPQSASLLSSVAELSEHGHPPNPPAMSEIRFANSAGQMGIDFQYVNGQSGMKFIVETVGGGSGVLDYDQDGWPDLYFPQGGRLNSEGEPISKHSDQLFRNRHGVVFENVSNIAGVADTRYSFGLAVGDYDNDGFPDLVIANLQRNAFYRNNGDGTFADVTDDVGFQYSGTPSSIAFADFDSDGLLDLYIVNYVQDPFRACHDRQGTIATCDPLVFDAQEDRIHRNAGDGKFEDVTAVSGIAIDGGKGLGVVTADFDADGKCDIYVANDGDPNFLFINRSSGPGDFRFDEVGLRAGVAVNERGQSEAGMGIACADFDGNSFPDIYVTNFYDETNTLYANLGGGVFADLTATSGHAAVTRPFLGFGTQAGDVNLDGLPDLAVTNGDIDDYSARGRPWKMRPLLFVNIGGGRFSEVGEQCGPYFEGTYLGRGMARLDWNRDARQDLLIVHYDKPAALLTNETVNDNRGFILQLRGVQSNRDGIGAVVRVNAGGRAQALAVCGGHGYCAANDPNLVIGTGNAMHVEKLEIYWPSGLRQEIKQIPSGSVILVVEGDDPVISPLQFEFEVSESQ